MGGSRCRPGVLWEVQDKGRCWPRGAGRLTEALLCTFVPQNTNRAPPCIVFVMPAEAPLRFTRPDKLLS